MVCCCCPFGSCCRHRKLRRAGYFVLPDSYKLIGPGARRLVRLAVQYALISFVLVILILWVASEVEEFHVKRAPSTLDLYEKPEVCGLTYTLENRTESVLIQTFPSEVAALESDNTLVAHCGDCGKCSNPHDINIYDDTKDSLFEKTVDCAKWSLMGKKQLRKCMERNVGFTEECNECWVENIWCDFQLCVFICLWQTLFSQVETGGDSQQLNRCTHCDEKRCGRAFVQCAGANRRRSGIVSDIERDGELEVCQSVESVWWKNAVIGSAWGAQYFDEDDSFF